MRMSQKVEVVGPRKAASLLKNNTSNRPLRERRVIQLQKAIERGEWVLNGESIKIGKDGVLLDGQHRLEAIRRSKTPCKVLVVRGVDPSAFDTIDQGARRNLADLFSVNGEAHYATLSASCRLLFQMNHSDLSASPTGPEAFDVLLDHPALRDSVQFVIQNSSNKVIASSVAGWAHYEMARRDKSLADEFWKQVGTGEMLKRSSAAYLLRERLIANKSSKAKLPKRELIALVVKAANAAMEGKVIRSLRMNKKEEFPSFVTPTKQAG